MSRVGEQAARDTTNCLDETTVTLFLARRLAPTPSGVLEQHIDTCPRCRRVLSALARSLRE